MLMFWAVYRKEGAAVLTHGNRGNKSHHAIDDKLKERVFELMLAFRVSG